MRTIKILLSAIALWCGPSGAFASVIGGYSERWWLMPGGSISATLPATGHAETFGGELSLVCHECGDRYWLGGYADIVGDTGRDQIRVSLGPEYGRDGAGIDGGPVIAFDSGETRGGLVVRGMLTIAVLGLYVRLGQLFINGSQTYVELGAYFKVPVYIARYANAPSASQVTSRKPRSELRTPREGERHGAIRARPSTCIVPVSPDSPHPLRLLESARKKAARK